jgi:myo-inositol-1(or 4)-monophosphatase
MLNVAIKAARAAGAIINRAALDVEAVRVSQKQVNDFVTEIDQASERIIIETLLTAYPDHGILAEESGSQHGNPNADHIWIIDPLDGTTNFLHGLPHFAISVAVEERGELIAGVVYQPLVDELFWAEKGQGAYLNESRLRVSGRDKMENALLATGIPFKGKEGHEEFMAEMAEFMPSVAGIRRFGSAALDLAYVAAGRYDGFWESNLQPWDIAAGILLVREAGGYVTDMNGGTDMLKTGGIIAANDHLHMPMQRVLKRAHRKNA